MDTATLELRLAEVQTAIHEVQTGAKAVRVTMEDGRSVEYNRASLAQLLRYRDSLMAQLGQTVTGVRSRTVVFR